MAKKALEDVYARFWTDEDGGHILPTHCGQVVEKPLMIWEVTMLLIAMETYYDATGDQETAGRIAGTWRYLKSVFTREQMVANFGSEPNLAVDDVGWDIMCYLMAYRFTGDDEALEMVKTTLLGAYEHYKDGDDLRAEGLWYNDWAQYNDQWKSSYIVSLLISALEYSRITKETDKFCPELEEKTLQLCDWVEHTFRRDRVYTVENGRKDGSPYTVDVIDHLYWIDFNKDRENRDERNGPSGGLRPHDIRELGSVSAIFANMGMAAVNVMRYEMFGDEECLRKAIQTADALEKRYDNNGAYLNDRDGHTNATMLRCYIHTLLGTERTTAAQRDLLFRTAENIFASARNCDGWYLPWWGKVVDRIPEMTPSFAQSVYGIMFNATSATMICGAALLESMGFRPGWEKENV
ncbi:MAG: hypothetical protein E7436_06340 [Ruminococcaceae bacterium]|nr:hypothetical protein [Oscillospiraceae bacterium]